MAATLTVTDALTGNPTPVGGRLLRLLVATETDRAAALRAHVIADVVRRFAELRGGRVVVGSSGAADVDSAALLALNVPPPDADLTAASADLVVTTGDLPAGARCALRVGAVRNAPAGLGAEPLTVRRTLLGVRVTAPVDLGGATSTAGADLARLRGLVAAWAERPSAAPPRDVVERFVAAVEDDLDLATAVRTLDECAADGAVPDGAKFELYAYADRVLAVDLARDVGRAGHGVAPNSV
jgi:hypothetical protein